MARQARDKDDYNPPASPAMLDPWRRLGLRAVVQALEDYHGGDLVRSLDALVFIIDPSPFGAAGWLDALGVGYGDPCDVFRRLTNGKAQKTTSQFSRRGPGRAKKPDPGASVNIPARAGAANTRDG